MQYFPNSLDDTLQSWHDDIRREFALEFAENSNQQTNWQTAVITSLSRVSGFFPSPPRLGLPRAMESVFYQKFRLDIDNKGQLYKNYSLICFLYLA